MSDIEQLQQAIDSIEAQRALFGDVATDIIQTLLQEKLKRENGRSPDEPPTASRIAQRKQVTILFANIAGFTKVAESIPETNMLDIMNALWRRLDHAITQQGGTIDKHMGDAVMGLFGVPVAHEDDPERAVRAALAMRTALAEFIAELHSDVWTDTVNAYEDGTSPLDELALRIGINTGPVILGEVGTGDEYTVIGDAVNIASRLERAAPLNGILIAHDTYDMVRSVFNMEPLGPVPIRGRSEPIQVYQVIGAKPRLFYEGGRGVEGVETRMVGRNRELQQLKTAYERAIGERRGQFVMITGDAGVGKSRLIHEYRKWLEELSGEIPIFKGRMYQQVRQLPYALIRDMLATYFGIQDNDPPLVAEEKLVMGMSRIMGRLDDEIRKKAQIVAQMIGLEVSTGVQLVVDLADMPQLRVQAYEHLAMMFTTMAQNYPAILIFLEDLHWADDSSLDLLAYLQDVVRQSPIVLVTLTRPVQEDSRIHLLHVDIDMPLKALPKAESQALVREILRKLPDIPTDLADLIVQRSEGNPFYVEELIKILIEDGVIIAGEDRWELRSNQLTEVRVPPHITGVLQARLDRLPKVERITLQRAAIVGRVFWDNAVINMNDDVQNIVQEEKTLAALQALEKREMIFRRQKSTFIGSDAYFFKHAILHQVTYESVLLRVRPLYHKQIADWLADQSRERLGEYAGVIAEHYEQAGENIQAAELYELAAVRARETYTPDLAIEYYRKALALITERIHDLALQLRHQEQLGLLLYQQARFVESAQAFMLMRFSAQEDGNLDAQARAGNGLARVYREQAKFAEMATEAKAAEEVAWLVNAEATLVRSLLLKGYAYLRLGELDKGMKTASRALSMSERPDEPEGMTLSLCLLIELHIVNGRYAEAEQTIEQLKNHLALVNVLEDEPAIALASFELGKIFKRLGRYDVAEKYFREALIYYRRLEHQNMIADVLQGLGEVAWLRGDLFTAVPYLRNCVAVANSIGDMQGSLKYRTILGAISLDLGHYKMAERMLLSVTKIVEDLGRMSNWHQAASAYAHLALAYLGGDNWGEAMGKAYRAYQLADESNQIEDVGLAWRALGQVLAQAPHNAKPLIIGEKTITATKAFARSLKSFEEACGGGVASYHGQIMTMLAWADYAQSNDKLDQAKKLRERAIGLSDVLDMVLVE